MSFDTEWIKIHEWSYNYRNKYDLTINDLLELLQLDIHNHDYHLLLNKFNIYVTPINRIENKNILKNKLKEYMKNESNILMFSNYSETDKIAQKINEHKLLFDSELGLFVQIDKIIYETFEYIMLDTFYNDKMKITDNCTDISINIIYLKCYINTEIFINNKDEIEEILLDEFINLDICDKIWKIKINEIIYWSIPKMYLTMY